MKEATSRAISFLQVLRHDNSVITVAAQATNGNSKIYSESLTTME